MKRRFILLDHSIEDATGHYLEYAKRVLRAARLAGFETVLGINQRAGAIACTEAHIVDKAFAHTFWENQAPSFGKYVAGIFRNSRACSGDLDVSVDGALLYANELRAFFGRVGPTAGDLVFVPTLGATELKGIVLYSGCEEAQDLHWHALFRRDLASSNALLEALRNARAHRQLLKLRTAFAEANTGFKKGKLSFYTDTETLTSSYEKLFLENFSTLPIPIDETLGIKKQTLGQPLLVSYLGDAREEKGFHLLPDLIASVRALGFDEKSVTFRVQANLPLGGRSAKARRAKAILTNHPCAGVALLDGPFDSETYHQLIVSSDVILIPYCPRSYAARSSGIFAEALAAGVPTIHPQGSWMAQSQGASGSLAYKSPADMSVVLARMLSNYSQFESKSMAFSHEWRNKHSARKLVCLLANAVPARESGVPVRSMMNGKP